MYLSLVFVHCLSHPCLVVLCKFNTVSGHISQCVCFVIYCCLSLFKCDNFLSLCFLCRLFCIVYHAFICFIQQQKKHAVVYFSIICKLINKKKSFFFPYGNYCMSKETVATYSEYLVEVDFLRIYTHINI